jgi:hypothetical protein
MGDLLNIAIRSSGSLTPPTLNVNLAFSGGQTGSTQIFKNGVLFDTLSTPSSINVPLVAGDTYNAIITSTSLASYAQNINGVQTDFGEDNITVSTPIYTALNNQIIILYTACTIPT